VLADATSLDMADWWEATKENYFSRVPKAQITAAVVEAVSPQAADNIARMKKDTMALRAEELVAGKRWLPEVLRTRQVSAEISAGDQPKEQQE
ncbi:MAG: hypothetical protein MN733_41740, partial [Nitrososphaera sp.]|nr:hypothetical protein [Nitrososphaera sp.]